MPVYEYACTECGEQLEVRQSFTDAALTVCPDCSGRLRKVLSPVGVVFKGSGFYRTDSRAAQAGANGDSGGADGKASGDKADAGGGQDGADKPSKDGAAAKKDSSTGSDSGGRGGGGGGGKDKAGSTSATSTKAASTTKTG